MSTGLEELTLNQRVGGSKPSRRTGQTGFPNLGTLSSTHIADDPIEQPPTFALRQGFLLKLVRDAPRSWDHREMRRVAK